MRTGLPNLLLVALVALAGCQPRAAKGPDWVPTQPEIQPILLATSTAPVHSGLPLEEGQSIEELVQMGLSANPRLQEMHYRIEADEQRIPQALTLPDPMVNANAYPSPVQTAAGKQAFSLGVQQKITNPDRRNAQAAALQEEVAAAEAELRAEEQRIAEQIRTASYQLLLVRASIGITLEDAQRLEQIVAVVEQQYEVQQSVSQQDVLNVQVEQSRVENQLTQLRQQERSFEARLVRLLHLTPGTRISIADSLQSIQETYQLDSLIEMALKTRPDLQAELARIRRDDDRIRVAQLADVPDFTVGLNWISTSASGISPVANGDDAVMLGLGFNLPIYRSRTQAQMREARASRLASEYGFQGMADSIGEEIVDLVAQLDSTGQTLRLMEEDILPKSQRTLDLAIDDYSTGSIEYVQLIENWRSVLQYRIAVANLQSRSMQLKARLTRAVGQLELSAQ